MKIQYLNLKKTTRFHSLATPYLSFPMLDDVGFIRHGFSTRLGGVSTGAFTSLNLSFSRGDDPDCVARNFERIAKTLSVDVRQMVYAMQTHTTNVLTVTAEHAGMGVVKERTYQEIDALVTNVPGIVLVTSHADCVPLFFVDPVRRAIGLAHSGWKGTVHNIAAATVEKMTENYCSQPEDILAFIGPSVCRNCYEVGEDVAEQFAQAYRGTAFQGILTPKGCGKFLLDLHTANFKNLTKAGLKPEHIGITDICTCCNPKLLFSHRASRGNRGGLCGFLQIRENGPRL